MILDTLADLQAEHALAAVAVDTPYGAQLAHAHGVRPEHFGAPTLGRLFAAAVDRVDAEDLEDRVAALARDAVVDVVWLTELVHAPRICMRDMNGSYARRVLAGAARVARYERCIDTLGELGIEVAA